MTNKFLEILVDKAHENGHIDHLRHNLLLKKNTPLGGERPLLVQVEIELNWTRAINLETLYIEPSTSLVEFGQTTETTSIDMGEV